MQNRINKILWGPTFKNTSYFSLRLVATWIHDGFLDSRWIPGFTMDSCIHDGFLDSRWVLKTSYSSEDRSLREWITLVCDNRTKHLSWMAALALSHNGCKWMARSSSTRYCGHADVYASNNIRAYYETQICSLQFLGNSNYYGLHFACRLLLQMQRVLSG